jgi:hypothetical protein
MLQWDRALLFLFTMTVPGPDGSALPQDLAA